MKKRTVVFEKLCLILLSSALIILFAYGVLTAVLLVP
jgi:hypothetical protein